jgi:hypothetical protein
MVNPCWLYPVGLTDDDLSGQKNYRLPLPKEAAYMYGKGFIWRRLVVTIPAPVAVAKNTRNVVSPRRTRR